MKKRYSLENEYWIKDNFTGKHLSMGDVVELLNRYENMLANELVDGEV